MTPETLEKIRKYIQQAHDDAEAKHDNIDGPWYMEQSQYEAMTETQELLDILDVCIPAAKIQDNKESVDG